MCHPNPPGPTRVRLFFGGGPRGCPSVRQPGCGGGKEGRQRAELRAVSRRREEGALRSPAHLPSHCDLNTAHQPPTLSKAEVRYTSHREPQWLRLQATPSTRSTSSLSASATSVRAAGLLVCRATRLRQCEHGSHCRLCLCVTPLQAAARSPRPCSLKWSRRIVCSPSLARLTAAEQVCEGGTREQGS